MPRPNVVLILSDDQDLRSLEEMPKTRARFAQGLEFENAFVTTPLCSPSRISLMTGKNAQNHEIGANDNAAKRFINHGYHRNSVGWWLRREAGYRAGYFGKVMNGYERVPTWELPGYSDFVGSLGNRDPLTWNRNGTVRRTSIARRDETKALGELATAFVENAGAAGDPFFAFCSIKAPHVPLDPSTLHKGTYNGVTPPWVERIHAGLPTNFDHHDPKKPLSVRGESPLTAAEKADLAGQWRRRMEELQDLDDQVDAIFDAVDLDDTYVIFTSDNGTLEGEHRLRYKTHPYEECVRVPMLVAGPGMRQNATSGLLVANTDIAPTILELAGLSPEEHGCDGRSLVAPMFDSTVPAEDWRGALAMRCDSLSGNASDWRALRTPDAMYVDRFRTGERELYFTDSDPYQLDNAAADPENAGLVAELADRLGDAAGKSGEALRTAETA